jgi:RNA polymerase sigma-70 factor (ECF subfamily)
METRLTDAEAVARARQGDTTAFGELVRSHQEAAFRAAYLILRDTSAAEDVVQEAFFRAYRHIEQFRAGEAFRPWLLRIATNLAFNENRARGRRLGLLERIGGLIAREEASAAEEKVAAGDRSARVLDAMNRLSEDDRLVLYLRYFLELDEREMAQVIGRPAGTVKSRLHRAGRRLREIIETDYPELRDANDR